MAKRVTAAGLGRGNGYDGDKLRAYVERIESLFEEIESSKGAHMNRCQKIRGSMEVVYEEAKALGIPKKVLKAHVDLRRLEAKKAKLVEKLTDEEVDDFQAMADALGDFATLPLGMAAVRRTADPGDADILNSLTE